MLDLTQEMGGELLGGEWVGGEWVGGELTGEEQYSYKARIEGLH